MNYELKALSLHKIRINETPDITFLYMHDGS